ncbi:AAA family ATPase [Rossellomorea sp. GCM10028870]|uniref:AAA family ATPase n=1 Tax=Rossellomorea sp. GCM10028870 TaxID=3273426 RepID=UPI00360E86A1
MKLLELHIYGYGKIENKRFSLKDLQLFYGENEAGKSTIMSFIHSILFGFPTKQQSLLRYEPKSSTEYGGKILCQMDGHGTVSIERIKGKATGDVTVQFEDGRMEGEETLQQLLGHMDRATYQNIFSFNLEGLQNIQRLKKEDLNRYLFSAGSTGTDLLLQLEQNWQKEREQLFKKSGRKPMINTVLTQLKSLEKQVREGKEKNEQYRPLIAKQQSLETRVSSMEAEKADLTEKKQNLVSVNENWDSLSGFKRVKERLAQLEAIEFPAKGLELLNELKTEERQVSAYLESLMAKQEKLQNKLESEEIDTSINEDLPFMEKIMSQQSFYLKWKEESSERSRELKTVRSKINDTIRELGLTVEMEEIQSLDTSLMMSDRIQNALDQQSKLLHERDSLHKHYEEEKEELHRIESKCDDLEERLMEEDEYQELQRTVKSQSSRQVSRDQAHWMNMQVKEAEERFSRNKASLSQQLLLIGAALLLLSGFGAWAIVTGNWLVTGISLLLLMVVGAMGMQARGNLQEESRSLQKAKARAEELQPEGKLEFNSPERAEQSLKQQMELRSEWKQRILSLEEQQAKLQKLHEKQKGIEKEIVLGEERVSHLISELCLPPDFHWKWLRDAFAKMKEAVSNYEAYIHLKEEQAYVFNKMNEYKEDCQEWFHRHSLTFTTVEEALIKLKGITQDIEKRKLIINSIQSELEPLSLEIEKLSIELRKIRDESQTLIESAGCLNEAEFREKALHVEERNELSAQYSGIKTRMTKRTFDTFLRFDSQEEIRKELTRVSQRIDKLSAELSAHQKELASISYEIKVLEEGKSYSSILQEFQGKKAELQELAYEWSKYTLAQVSLSKTMDLYQKTKMPKVMKLAEENFRELTEDHYLRIFLQEDEMIRVERKDGAVFHAVELSQGTKEQLYIAIRFALIQSFRDKYPLPVLIDDGVVNFDRERTNAFLKLLRKMAKKHQILFFTCHPHIKNTFSGEEMIVLKRMEKEAIRTS